MNTDGRKKEQKAQKEKRFYTKIAKDAKREQGKSTDSSQEGGFETRRRAGGTWDDELYTGKMEPTFTTDSLSLLPT